jgi:hypothetical protein
MVGGVTIVGWSFIQRTAPHLSDDPRPAVEKARRGRMIVLASGGPLLVAPVNWGEVRHGYRIHRRHR